MFPTLETVDNFVVDLSTSVDEGPRTTSTSDSREVVVGYTKRRSQKQN